MNIRKWVILITVFLIANTYYDGTLADYIVKEANDIIRLDDEIKKKLVYKDNNKKLVYRLRHFKKEELSFFEKVMIKNDKIILTNFESDKVFDFKNYLVIDNFNNKCFFLKRK